MNGLAVFWGECMLHCSVPDGSILHVLQAQTGGNHAAGDLCDSLCLVVAFATVHLFAMQAGASLTLGAALISLIYPVRVGALGYGLILYAILKAKAGLMPPALIFIPIFLIATDVFSLFQSRRSISGHNQSTQSTARPAASTDTAATATPAKPGKAGATRASTRKAVRAD